MQAQFNALKHAFVYYHQGRQLLRAAPAMPRRRFFVTPFLDCRYQFHTHSIFELSKDYEWARQPHSANRPMVATCHAISRTAAARDLAQAADFHDTLRRFHYRADAAAARFQQRRAAVKL